jgi:hypothetical protein
MSKNISYKRLLFAIYILIFLEMKKIENLNPSSNLKKESPTSSVKAVNELLMSQKPVSANGNRRRSWTSPETGRPEIVAHEIIIM